MNSPSEALFYEEHLTSPSNLPTLLTLGTILACVISWKLLVNDVAFLAMILLLATTYFAYLGRSSRIAVTRESVILDGVIKIAPLSIQKITKTCAVEKRRGLLYSISDNQPIPVKAFTLPLSIPSLF